MHAPATLHSATAAPIVVALNANMDRDPYWTAQGQWQWGQPLGGGSYNRDPTSAYTGPYVYGYNLAGDYPNNLPATYLTTTPVNCTGLSGVTLEFWRWLGVESNSNYDKATVEVSNNGVNWTVIWTAASTGAAVRDTSWVYQSFDISSVANNQPAVRIRSGMGPTDSSITYPGWNIDDVKVWAGDPSGCPPSNCPGDANCDLVVSWRDIDYFVAGMNDSESAWRAKFAPGSPSCAFSNCDVSGDGHVTWRDIAPFVGLMNTTCP